MNMQGQDSILARSGSAQNHTRFHVVAAVGGVSVAFSVLCLYFVPIFGGLLFLAILAGSCSVSLALVSRANRVAIAVGAFALTPIFRFTLFEKASDLFGTSYVTFYVPVGVATAIAVGVYIDYFRSKRALNSDARR
jgi:hypothetical protein